MKKLWFCALAISTLFGTVACAQDNPKADSKPVASSGKESSMSSGRRYINLPGRPPNLPFSDAVLVGDTLYIAGRIGIDPATGQAAKDVNEELRLLFDGFQAVLAQAGMTMDDLVYVQIYSPDV